MYVYVSVSVCKFPKRKHTDTDTAAAAATIKLKNSKYTTVQASTWATVAMSPTLCSTAHCAYSFILDDLIIIFVVVVPVNTDNISVRTPKWLVFPFGRVKFR